MSLTVRPSVNLSGTIAVTNTFQSIAVKSNYRQGGVIQNNAAGQHDMFVFIGPIANATKATSIWLAAGQSLNLNFFDIAVGDQISITGTATESFLALIFGEGS